MTAVMEGLAEQCLMAELDRDVAAFWEASLRHGAELCDMIANFQLTREAALEVSLQSPHDAVQRGFRTLILNRTRRSGILAPGASLSRAGENGKGIASRWYPETIIKRLREIAKRAERIDFREMDGMELLEETLAGNESDAAFFVDPPYTAGGKRAGKRLYAHNEIDHPRLFAMLADSGARFLMTYDRAPEIESWIRRHGFHAVQVFMKNAHHNRIPELVITPQPAFLC